MRLASPDEALISVVDRFLAVPQRRGVPLPRAVMPLHLVNPAGYLMASAASAVLTSILPPASVVDGQIMMLVFGVAALSSSLGAYVAARRLRRDADDWSTANAVRYRSDALEARESEAFMRYIWLVSNVLFGSAACYALVNAGRNEYGTCFAMLTVGLGIAALGHLMVQYAGCAMPRDPDATIRTVATSGAP